LNILANLQTLHSTILANPCNWCFARICKDCHPCKLNILAKSANLCIHNPCKSLQLMFCKDLQGCCKDVARICKDLQGWWCNTNLGIHEVSRICKDLQGFARILQGFARKNSTGVCWLPSNKLAMMRAMWRIGAATLPLIDMNLRETCWGSGRPPNLHWCTYTVGQIWIFQNWHW